MLKDIGCFPEIDVVVRSAKRICRFLYNHSTLHAEMYQKIGGDVETEREIGGKPHVVKATGFLGFIYWAHMTG